MNKLVRFGKTMCKSATDYILKHPYWVGGIVMSIVVSGVKSYKKFEKENNV